MFEPQILDEFCQSGTETTDTLAELSSHLVFPLVHGIEVRKHPPYLPPYLHTHEFLEMCYAVRGKAKHETLEREVVEEAGSLLVLPPGVYHTIVADEGTIAINILVSISSFPALLALFSSSPSPLGQFFSSLRENNGSALFLKGKPSDEANGLLLLLIRHQSEEAIAFPLLSSFLHLIVQSAEVTLLGEQDNKLNTASAILAYMRHELRTISLQTLSSYFNLSEERVAQIIRKSTGATYSALLKQMRIEKSIQLLQTTNLSCKEIAGEIGITTAEHFSRSFRIWTGKSPTDFRSR